MKPRIKELILIPIIVVLVVISYKIIGKISINQQDNLISNFNGSSKLNDKITQKEEEKRVFEVKQFMENLSITQLEMEELKKNLSMTQNKIKELELERLLLKNSFEPDIKVRIEALKAKYKIRNIIAYVFYGRREFTKILFRYLDSNLRINGGILDKILLIDHLLGSEKVENKKYLTEYLAEHKTGYELIAPIGDHNFRQLYSILDGNDLVFKIDDDTVFIANGTFESMVEDYLKNDRFITSGNVVNHHTFSGIHRNMNLLVPFYDLDNNTWIQGTLVNKKNESSIFEKCTSNRLANWRDKPKCAAIAHENLIYNAYKYKFNLTLYDFKIFDLYSFKYEAFRINFILFRGNILNKIHINYKHVESDEEIITKHLPTENKKHIFAIGAALVSHFAYSTDGNYEYLSKTDLLSKYDKLSIDYFKNQ